MRFSRLVVLPALFAKIIVLNEIQEAAAAGWQARLSIINGKTRMDFYFGTHPEATDGFDINIDQPAPPAGFGFYAAFQIASFPAWLISDFRDASDSSHTWTLVIANAGATTSTICWDVASLQNQNEQKLSLLIDEQDMFSDTCMQVTGNQSLTIKYMRSGISAIHAQAQKSMTQPIDFRLSDIYPNPFMLNRMHTTAQMTLTLALRMGADVAITVYALSGQRVSRIFNRYLPPGEYTVKWDGKDTSGNKVSAGLYFVQVKAKSIIFSRKVLVLN